MTKQNGRHDVSRKYKSSVKLQKSRGEDALFLRQPHFSSSLSLSLSHTITLSLSFYPPIYLFPPFSFSFPGALGSSSLISTAQTVRHAVARYCYANDFCASEELPGRSKTSRAAAKADLTCCNAHGKNAPARLDIF